jgi:hypothetical protein
MEANTKVYYRLHLITSLVFALIYVTEHQYVQENYYFPTERSGQVVNTPAPYSGCPGFKLRPGDRLP